MILLVSDLDLHGSGYLNIAIALSSELHARGRNLTVLGIGYDGAEHSWPFQIIPVDPNAAWQGVSAMVNNFDALGQKGQHEAIEAIVIALDIPHHQQGLRLVNGRWPYIGIFPVESGPVRRSWAAIVASMSSRLVISEFGKGALRDAGITAEHLRVGVDMEAWRPPRPEERASMRKALDFGDDVFHVLTVADNQERKNLSAAAEAISILVGRGIKVRWSVVTRVNAFVGWNLDDLAADFAIQDSMLKYERGIAHDRLWLLHATSDAFLLTSKAEGCCLPVLEAMASRLPIVVTDCTSLHEHLCEPGSAKATRGFPIRVRWHHMDPWGNSIRHYIDPVHAADQLERVYRMRGTPALAGILDRAQAYIADRPWSAAGELLNNEISRAMTARNGVPTVVERQDARPVTIPHAIPIQEPQMRVPGEAE
jgi:glycosyltransferase involved in cell wall biosynthesis